jgi:quercetin dioxygenase-like cupin family protein
MIQSFGELNINAYQPHRPEGVVLTRLFEHEELRAELVVLPPRTAIPQHTHDHAHELFDVIDGNGVFVVGGVDFPGPAGKCVFVKAGTPHAMRNDSDQPWTVRVTYQQRIYPRHVGKLVGRAFRKRLRLEQ